MLGFRGRNSTLLNGCLPEKQPEKMSQGLGPHETAVKKPDQIQRKSNVVAFIQSSAVKLHDFQKLVADYRKVVLETTADHQVQSIQQRTPTSFNLPE